MKLVQTAMLLQLAIKRCPQLFIHPVLLGRLELKSDLKILSVYLVSKWSEPSAATPVSFHHRAQALNGEVLKADSAK
jgi:hypothetical protein